MRTTSMLVLEGGLVLLALVLGIPFGIAPLATLSLTATGLLLGVVATLPMLAMLGMLSRSSASFLREIRERVERAVWVLCRNAGPLEIALVCAAAGLGEEALFRGFLQGFLESLFGPAAALVLASALFGAAHPVTRMYALIAAAIGLYLGTLWIVTGNLLVPVIAHGLYDFVAVITILRRRQTAADLA